MNFRLQHPDTPDGAEVGAVGTPTSLSDQTGKPSLMRRMSLASFVASVIVAFIMVLGDGPDSIRSPDVYIFTAFLVAGFAPKAVQKFAETRFPMPPAATKPKK